MANTVTSFTTPSTIGIFFAILPLILIIILLTVGKTKKAPNNKKQSNPGPEQDFKNIVAVIQQARNADDCMLADTMFSTWDDELKRIKAEAISNDLPDLVDRIETQETQLLLLKAKCDYVTNTAKTDKTRGGPWSIFFGIIILIGLAIGAYYIFGKMGTKMGRIGNKIGMAREWSKPAPKPTTQGTQVNASGQKQITPRPQPQAATDNSFNNKAVANLVTNFYTKMNKI